MAAAETTQSILGRVAHRTGRVLARTQHFVESVPPWLVLGCLVVVSWVVAGESARIAHHNGPMYYHGGDGTFYYSTAWALGHGVIPLSAIGYGYSLLIAPIAALAGPSLVAGLPGIIALNQLVLAPIALLCVYGIARMLAGRVYAYLAVLTWVLFPVAVIHYFLADYHSRYVDITLPSAVGLLDLGDYPSMVILLVAAYFTLRAASSGRSADALAAGFAAGLAIAIKPSNALFLPAPALALLVARRPRALGLTAAGVVPSVLGIVAWKQRGLGTLPVLSHGSDARFVLASLALTTVAGIHMDWHRYLPFHWGHLHHNLDGLREFTWSQRMIYFAAGGGLVGLARRSTVTAVLAATWLGAYMLVKGSAPQVDITGGGFFTHLIAAFPAFFLLVISVPFLLPFYGRRRPSRASAPDTSRLPVVAAAVLGFLAVGGAAAVAAIPTSTKPRVATLPGNLLVPIDTFPLSVSTVGPRVELTWPPQSTEGATATYSILRNPAPSTGVDCPLAPNTSATCDYPFTLVTTIDGNATSFTDKPGAGNWIYRVGQSIGPIGRPSTSDLILLSRPVHITTH
jgi:hypothetical protein